MAKKPLKPYTEKRGGGEFPWRVRWPIPGQKTANGRQKYDQAGGFAEETDAYDYGIDQMSDMRHGRWIDPRKAATPFGEWCATVMEVVPQAPVTAAKRRRFLRLHILPTFEFATLAEVNNRFAIKTWAAKLTLAPESVKQAVGIVSFMLTAAADATMIQANAIYRMELSFSGEQVIQSADTERVWALPEQAVPVAARLWNAGKRSEALMVLTAAFVGLRYGELAGLHVDNCCLVRRDLLAGAPWLRHVIRIDPQFGALHETTQLDRQGNERTILYLGPPKPPNGARESDVPPFLAQLLSAHVAAMKAHYGELDRQWALEHDEARDRSHDMVFVTPQDASLWRRSNWSRTMRPACDGRDANAPRQGTRGWPQWEPLMAGLELHGLRHGHKTAMEEDEIADLLQDQAMGHEVPPERREIGKRYTHITAVMRKKRLDALTARWEKAGGAALGFAA